METLLEKTLKQIETERYEYVTKKEKKVTFQRLNKDYNWYAIYENQIVYWSRYRNDLEEWCDMAL